MTIDLNEALAAKKGQAPALAALALNRSGVLGEACVGVRRAKNPQTVELTDPWHLGSCTKAMTAALYARFVEAGKLGFTSHIGDLLPALAPQMHAEWKTRTASQVMSHSAGLDDSAMGVGWLLSARDSKRPVSEQRLALVRKALGKAPRKAGRFAYANMNYVLIGAILEQVSGEQWERLIEQEVFTPLGIRKAGFGAPKGAVPWGHSKQLFGGLNPVEPDLWADNPAAMGPAGTVHMPLRDWARFVRPFLSPNEDSPGFLKAASLTRLLSPQVSDAEMGAEIALGWLIAKREWAKVRGGAGTVFNHAGSNTMWFCSIWGAPEAGFATLQASNAGPNVAGGPVDAAAGVMIDRFGKL